MSSIAYQALANIFLPALFYFFVAVMLKAKPLLQSGGIYICSFFYQKTIHVRETPVFICFSWNISAIIIVVINLCRADSSC